LRAGRQAQRKVQPKRNSDARREKDRMFTPNLVSFTVLGSTAGDLLSSTIDPVIVVAVAALFLLLFVCWLCVRFVPNDYVAIVEKLWSASGSVPEGGIIALGSEAGYQAELLRGGVHFG